jgi:hypothetical protein
VGVLVKGAIAYAGTYVVGKGAEWFWRTGRELSRQHKERLYRQMLEEATRVLAPPTSKNTTRSEQDNGSAPP